MHRSVRRYRQWSLLISLVLCIGLLATACNSGGPTNARGPDGANGKGCTNVGVLLPDAFASSDRWETKDHPLLIEAITKALPGVHIEYHNAQDSQDTQLRQATAAMAKGVCILVVAAHDSVAASAIVEKARVQHVPVIAYDRLIQSRHLNYYVSFDGVKVGLLQGQYIAKHYQEYVQNEGPVNIAMISGSQTDTNALLFSMGMHQALDPLFANGTLKSVGEVFTPDWNNNTAQAEMEALLSDQQNNIQIAYVANDGMANSSIAALEADNAQKVLVTGQDATVPGIRNILAGKQSMTVYKPISKLAESTASLVKALHDGADVSRLINGEMTTYDGGTIPSILDEPISVDINTIAKTVIADGFVDKKDVCADIPPGTAGVC